MANLRDIKKRITSVQSTKQITRTMEMVASAKITSATRRVAAATPYSEAMDEMLERLSEQVASSSHPLLAKHEEIKAAIIVAIVSDRGLAGGFNTNVLRHCDHLVRKLIHDGVDVSLIACGKKAVTYFNYRKYSMIKEFRDLSADPTLDEAVEIASICSEMFTSGKVDEVFMVYNHARNSADQDLREEQILPVDPLGNKKVPQYYEDPEKAAQRKKEAEPKSPFEFEPDADSVLVQLLPSYLQTSIYHGLIDSAAAEQGARRKAMKAAQDEAPQG